MYRRGNLIQLGRLIHAIADVAVPGHVSGRLLHPEHLVMEGGAESFLDDFITYARNREQTSVTGAIQPTYARSGDTVFELNGLVDTKWIEEQILRIVGNSDDFQQKSIELLTEDAAFRTFAEAQRRRMLGQFDPPDGRIAPEVRRAFLSRAMLNIILGSTRAMQMFYGDQSSRTWDQMTQRVTWTARDLALRAQQPARGRRVTSPRVELPTYSRARQSYTGNVDAFYQEWQEIDGCYVESHNWNPATGPTFVNTLELGAEVQLSPANRGIKGDRIHVTGAYSAGKTHISYFNDHLADSAGRTVRIPAGALSEGVAVWCTGPDIWNTGRHEEDGQGETGSICDIAEIRPTGGLACNFAESLRFRPRAQSVGGVVLPGTTGGRGAGGGSAPIRVTPIVAVAKQIKVSPRVLTTAVASAGNNKTTLVYPSAIGKAEISWNDKKSGLSSHVVISRTGRVTLKRTATRQLKALR